jgi:Fur family ferric uptake transcriptional regulator
MSIERGYAQGRKLFYRVPGETGAEADSQRRKILECFLSGQGHLSAEDLYALVKKADSSVGLVTVFRTLKLLSEADIASEVDLGDKRVRYEPKIGSKDHFHLVCESCGKMVEAHDPAIERLESWICGKYGFFRQAA